MNNIVRHSAAHFVNVEHFCSRSTFTCSRNVERNSSTFTHVVRHNSSHCSRCAARVNVERNRSTFDVRHTVNSERNRSTFDVHIVHIVRQSEQKCSTSTFTTFTLCGTVNEIVRRPQRSTFTTCGTVNDRSTFDVHKRSTSVNAEQKRSHTM